MYLLSAYEYSVTFFNSLCLFSGEVAETALEYISKIQYRKGEIIFRAGDLNSKLYFIEQGLVRGFVFSEEETTNWLLSDGDWIGSVEGNTDKLPLLESFEAI